MQYAIPGETIKLEPLSKFLKEMGLNDEVEAQPSLKITNISSLPEETKVVVLNCQRSKE
jgi:hypothetical protein